MSNPQQLVQKLWNYCTVLLQAGLHYSDYTEQLTFGSVAPATRACAQRFALPVSLVSRRLGSAVCKMADEQSRAPFNKPSAVPKEFAWPSLLARPGRLLFLKAFTGELV